MIFQPDQLEKIKKAIKCRDKQITLLDTLLWEDPRMNPSAIVLHGAKSTGKSTTLQEFLDLSTLNYSWISCNQCITPRILFQKALKSIYYDTDIVSPDEVNNEVAAENFTVFSSLLEDFFVQNNYNDVHVLVLDGLDTSFEDSNDLFSCFCKINEMCNVDNLVTIFVVNSLEPRALIANSIPHIWFSRYSKEESITIISGIDGTEEYGQLWTIFCSLVYDSLGAYTGSDIRLLKHAALKLWPIFIKPVENGKYTSRQVAQLLRHSESYFGSEYAVADRLVESAIDNLPITYELPTQSKYILCAAYLASYNPPQFDIRFFSKAKEARAKRRDTSRRKALKINPRSLAAPAFELERMLAILHSIYDDDDFASSVDVGVQIATLTTLKLIVRTSSNDPLDSRTKWKINTEWDFIAKLASEIDLEISEYIME